MLLVEAPPVVPLAASVGVAELDAGPVPVDEGPPVLEWEAEDEVEVGRSATVTPCSKHLDE